MTAGVTSSNIKVSMAQKRMIISIALAAEVIVLIADQLTKVWILNLMNPPRVIEIFPFFNLVLTWNKGVSFGMLSHDSAFMPYVLMSVALILLGVLGYWLTSVKNTFLAVGIGLVMGGAVGNLIDRIRFGAVVDFLDFYAFDWHWPAFNVADSAICLGVALMLVDGLFFSDSQKKGA